MPIDASIPMMVKGPEFQDPMDIQQKAMTMKQMALKNQSDQKAMDYDERLRKLDFIGRVGGSVTDQKSYDEMKSQAHQLGFDVANLPMAYDPNFMKASQAMALSAKEKMLMDNDALNRDEQRKDRAFDRNIELQKLQLQKDQAKQASGGFEGRKAVDKDYAKDYNEWTASGRGTVEKNIERLENAKLALKKTDDPLTGSIRGYVPDFIRGTTNEKAITTRDDVRAAAQGALKATLGAQFTEKEGERIMNQAYNEKLSPEANIAKIDAAIAELRKNQSIQDAKARYFEERGTLNGFKFDNVPMLANQRQTLPENGFVLMQDPQGKTRQVSADQVQDAIKAGGKVINNNVAGGR